jgi:hypothetical protein
MEYYEWSRKKKICFVIFVCAAMAAGGLLYFWQRSKGCPIVIRNQQQAELRQAEEDSRTAVDPDPGGDDHEDR